VGSDYECRYSAEENKWFVLADTRLSLPPSELKRIGLGVRHIWLEKLKTMDGVKDILKISYIRKALQALENNDIAQVWRVPRDG
jgi:hypothetical protein